MRTTSTGLMALTTLAMLTACGVCRGAPSTGRPSGLPLAVVADVPLPGGATRLDYQDVDAAEGHLVIAHMNDASVVIVNLSDGALVKLLPGISTPRGVAVADDVGRIFVTSSPSKLVIIDNKSFSEIARVPTGNGPDGVAWDATDQIVAVSDQSDGAISLIAKSGSGQRTQIKLGTETGNVVFDVARHAFWISVGRGSPPDQLVSVNPISASITARIDLPGCDGAHGVRLHPDGKSAYVACENNDRVARVELDGKHGISIAACGAGPDVMSIDPGLGWLYVAAESGDLVVFDTAKTGLTAIDHEHPGEHAHSVAVDPKTHHVFFPLMSGRHGKPMLRIMQPR